ncbi:Phosphatidylinositol 3- and 4-kinase family protein [Trichomonas vaginalis G3]|uniref:phosphatidylinositol 3-kinase n=1 Tax=Trichomonas vaginalis (strain ATCC PRA-98 / G3) TaxID=412133 RepID=A2DYA6_TRIV3|nr:PHOSPHATIDYLINOSITOL KINASE family [Trichomonas vaginalis G3]EAY14583.1 Phosphatidylinositol 3- and 4-kinase family protein [Trichomonas vaginalis G3]KAI5526594.1 PHOSPHATIDYLINOSITOL KINASE family [Trichomonas vaginalis G3]|eukprot:XP_001326806.1 Phosphatidylinositol 3- and 4-kinase family protein [Trichomonas vaginalis G3]
MTSEEYPNDVVLLRGEYHHYLDLVIDKKTTYSFPIFPTLTGENIIQLINDEGITNFVICNTESDNLQKCIVFSTDQEIFKSNFDLNSFSKALVSEIVTPNRYVATKCQRMTLNVYEISEFQNKQSINESIPTIFNSFAKSKTRKINVKIPTSAIIEVSINIKWTLKKIHKHIYSVIEDIFGEGNIPQPTRFRFIVIGSPTFPSYDLPFEFSPEMIGALWEQIEDPHGLYFDFVFVELDNSVMKSFQQYASELDLSLPALTPDTLSLYSSLSDVRFGVETSRITRLSINPLLSRMRLSETDPPLHTCNLQFVFIRAELRVGVNSSITGASFRVEREKTADDAILVLLKKMNHHHMVNIEQDPSNFAFVLQGTDEIIAGHIPMDHFISVRQFLLSGQPVMNVLLYTRDSLIASVYQNELSHQPLEEPSKSEFSTDFAVVGIPKRTFGYMPCTPHILSYARFGIFLSSLYNLPITQRLQISCSIIHGKSDLVTPVTFIQASGYRTQLINRYVEFQININSIPRSALLSITIENPDEKPDKPERYIASMNYTIFSHDGWVRSTPIVHKMWRTRAKDYLLPTRQTSENNTVVIHFRFTRFRNPLMFIFPQQQSLNQKAPHLLKHEDQFRLKELEAYDPLMELTDDDRKLIWLNRNRFVDNPKMLPLVLQSVDYTNTTQINEIPYVLAMWKPLDPTGALTLLDAKFADENVRKYAVDLLDQLNDSELLLYILQLTQALKYEVYEDSALVRFLIRRGLNEPKFVGHHLFWLLMSEAHISAIRERFSAVVVNFIYGIGHYRDELITGFKFTKMLVELNHELCKQSYSEATVTLRNKLKSVVIPPEFHLPVDPRLVVDRFIIEECKVMNSKKKPFWLTFHNAAPFSTEPIQTMFKVGDDLRQDHLTLQVMKVMDYIWRQNNLDLRMSNYSVLPTGLNQGFIEVVPNSVTEQKLQQEKGKMGSFDENTFIDYLKLMNTTEQTLQMAKENFMLSSAGYAVATCILGVADRHPGNIMLQQDGHFFHIDFGHFLGNFKKKLGYKRENAPFHFLPACVVVLDGQNGKLYKEFEQTSIKAYNVMREKANLIMSLMLLMLGTGIPELQKPSDLQYMKDMLHLNVNEREDADIFKNLIKISTESTKTAVNNWIHNLVCK